MEGDCSIDLVRKIKLVKFNVRKLRYGDPIYITTSLPPFTTKLYYIYELNRI